MKEEQETYFLDPKRMLAIYKHSINYKSQYIVGWTDKSQLVWAQGYYFGERLWVMNHLRFLEKNLDINNTILLFNTKYN